MSPIAAYYVMIATETDRARKPRFESIVPRPSLVERVAIALETLIRLGRPSTVQPI